MKSIHFLVSWSPAQICRTVSLGLGQALTRLGVRCTYFSASPAALRQTLADLPLNSPDGLALVMTRQQLSFARFLPAYGLPLFYYTLESELYFREFASQARLFATEVLSDSSTAFLPPAVAEEDFVVPFAERTYPISLIGHWVDPDKRRLKWKKEFSAVKAALLNVALDQVMSDSSCALLEAVQRALRLFALPADSVADLVAEVETVLQGYRLLEILARLQAHELHIFGAHWGADEDWRQIMRTHPKVYLHPFTYRSQLLHALRNSKIVLLSAPHLCGVPPYCFDALAAGALPFVNATSYLCAEFQPGAEIALYRYPFDTQEIERLEALLYQESHRHEIVLAGQQRLRKNHLWKERAERLLIQKIIH